MVSTIEITALFRFFPCRITNISRVLRKGRDQWVYQDRVVDPYQIDADPDSTYHPDADPDSTYHPDANPDPDPSFQIKAQTLQKMPK